MSNDIYVDTFKMHRGVFWVNRFATPPVAEEEFFDVVDGSYCVQHMPVDGGGRDIQLLAEGSDSGGKSFFSHEFVQHLYGLIASRGVVPFIYGDIFSGKVRVPVDALTGLTPLRKMIGHTKTDIYYGTLLLKEVV